MKKNNNKGFTLAELLIVVAIIAVLVAIAIPVFSAQLHKAQDATDIANCRSLYADLQADFLTNYGSGAYTQPSWGVSGSTITFSDGQTYTLKGADATVTATCDTTNALGWTVTYKCGKTGCVNNTPVVFGAHTTTGGSGS